MPLTRPPARLDPNAPTSPNAAAGWTVSPGTHTSFAVRARYSLAAATIVGALAAATGVVLLAGWMRQAPWLRTVGGGLVGTAPFTAVSFVLLAASLLLQVRPRRRRALLAARALAAAAGLIGAIFLLENVQGWSLGLDDLLFPGALALTRYPHPGRAAPTTAVCLLLLTFSLLLLDPPKRWQMRAAVLASLLVLLVALEVLVGYAFGAAALYRPLPDLNPMALSTAVAIFLLSAGTLLVRPRRGVFALVNADGSGGHVARWLLPAAVLVPLVLGWLNVLADRLDLVKTPTGDSILAVTNVVLFSALVLVTAAMLQGVERRRAAAEVELRISETQLRHRLAEIEAIYESAPVGLCVLDHNLTFVRINKRLAEINGLPVEDHIGRSVHEVVPTVAQEAEPLLRRVLETGEPIVGLELSGETAAQPGVVRHWVEHYLPIRGLEGEILGVNVVAEEVTEQKRATAALAASEERFRQIVSQAAVGIAQADPDGVLISVNPGFCRILGCAEHELVGRSVLDLTHPDDVAVSGARLAEVKRGDIDGYSLEKRFLRKDGAPVWCALTVSAVRIGASVSAVAIVQDITIRRAALAEQERLLKELDLEREQLRTVFDVAPAGICVAEGPELVVRRANATMRGYTPHQELAGLRVRDAFPQLTGLGLFERMEAAYTTGTPYSAQEVRIESQLRPTAETFWDVTYHPLKDRSGSVFALLVHVVDVTERVRARLAAEESSRAKSQFLAVISHEFRTPLGAIIGYADLLGGGVTGALSPRQNEFVSRVKATAWHLNTLVEQILTFSRAEAGKLEVNLEWVDAGAMAREIAAMLEPQAHGKGIRLEVDVPPDLLGLQSDPGKLRQILLNLLGNAVKFTDSGSVTVSATAGPADLIVRIADSGPGIAPEHQESVFELFSRPGAASAGKAGAGLGLPVTRQLVRLLGGSLTLESEPGRGCTFELRLPLLVPAMLRPE